MQPLPFLAPQMRRGANPQPKAETAPWYKIVNKAKSNKTKVYIYDAIGGWFGVDVNEFIKELNDIETDEIELHINSPGGSVYDGIAIYNALGQHDAKVTTYIDSLAASSASFVALAGEEVIIARNATMMIHDAMGSCFGNKADMEYMSERLDKVSDNIADMYAFNAGGTVEEWRELMKAETWYSASEAVEAGLADRMLDADDEDDDAEGIETENHWDLSKFFNYAGREQAPAPDLILKKVRNQITKEASMGSKAAPKNTEGTEETPAAAPETTEAAPAEAAPEETPETGAEPEQEPTPTSPENRAQFSVLVNGTAVSDLGAIQSHITALETFRNETITQGRTDFVADLAKSGKIPATQIDKLTAFALKLDDEQFNDWKDSYDSAPSMSLFDPHGTTPGNSSAPVSNGNAITAEIDTLEAIVADHRRTGMSQEQIEAKESYKRLQQLKSQQNA